MISFKQQLNLFGFLLLSLCLMGNSPQQKMLGGTIGAANCNETDIRNAIQSGGTVDFTADCTVTLTSNISITTNTIINGNDHRVEFNGGGTTQLFFITGGPVEMNGLILTNGYINNNDGSILYQDVGGVSLTIRDSTVSNSLADGFGSGAITIFQGGLNIYNSTISGNSGDLAGGIWYAPFPFITMVLDNSTLSGNVGLNLFDSGSAGGIYAQGAVDISNSTITANTGSVSFGVGGGGILGDSATITIQNSIISGNNVTAGTAHDCGGTVVSNGHNVVGQSGNANGCPTNGTNDLLLPGAVSTVLNSSLADNGGPTSTHALPASSPAIDRIANGASGCLTGSSIDQRFAPRAGGANNGGPACDSGAYEFDSIAPTAVALKQINVQRAQQPISMLIGSSTLLLLLLTSLLLWHRSQTDQ